ncbi:metal ABC transporter substrate-binding protein [Anaerofilum sp. BX8]|uniref:Lipoprotein n=1 Tax=Anaerofilum hominis TaxID=2763016 RepID=A0A923I8B5_9FIRM|nr:MetQ/NlpA family ABC transporter substrate-binding protein [Anaerofilum hominis]MBC5580661.1 metal ABC transporter substrate-binding protein [Anaerofilum hominis]
MKKKFIPLISAALALSLALTGCGGSGSSAAGSSAAGSSAAGPSSAAASSTAVTATLTVGASPSPHAQILNDVIAPLLAAQGIELVVREFDDYIIPNTALEAGELDANYFQHTPYLENFNEENGTHLAVGAEVHFETMALYPGKTASLDVLADGASIAIPNDTTNEARALQLLAAQGLITLKEGVGLEATPNDVVENPKNLKFEEVVAAQIPNLLADVDLGIANGNYALGAGIAGTAIAKEGADSEAAQTYPNVLAIREGDERPELKALIEAMTSPEVKAYIEETYEGTVIAVF